MTTSMARFRAGAGALAIALAGGLATGAQAQISPGYDMAQAPSGPTTAEIVVTAQFRSQRLQDTPLSITAVTATTLQARDQRSIADLGQFAPNVNISQGSSLYGNAVSAFIRGVGQNDSNFALEPGVGIYIDDVYYGTTFGAVMDLTDLERAEILRGPQGTLAGKNSIGGALKLYTKKPNDTDTGYVEATYGRFNRYDLRASGNFKLADGWYVRISGIAKGSEGYMKLLDYGCANPGSGIASQARSGGNCQTGSEGGGNVKALRAALRFAPAGSPWEVNISADVSTDKSEAVATKLLYANNSAVRSYVAANPTGGVPFDSRFITPAGSYTSYASYCNGGNYTTVFGFPYQVTPGFCASPTSSADSWGVSAAIDYKLSESLALKSITAYREAKGEAGIDVDGSPLDILTESVRMSHKQFTQELRLSGKMGGLLDFTLGGYYYKASDRQAMRVEIPSVMMDFLTNDPVSNESVSVFAHTEWHLAPKLNLIGGLRYTHDDKTYTFHRYNTDGSLPTAGPFVDVAGTSYPASWVALPLGGPARLIFPQNFLVAGLDGVAGRYKKGQVDWRIGLNYRFSPELMTYAQVSTGFKGGGISPTPYVADQARSFNPEKVTAYEIGFKADLFGRKLRLNGAAFYNDYRDMQMTLYVCPVSVSPSPCSLRANAGNAKVKGLELEASLRPVEGLSIDANIGYLDFEYGRVDPNTGVTAGMKAPFNAEWQASAGISYRMPFAGGSLTPRLDWDYRSSFYNNAVNLPLNNVAGRSLFNARLTYEPADKVWSVSLGVTNLFDKYYMNAVNENASNYGVVTGVLGRPREWSVSVRRNF
ncbi:TonB-dependent receptor [Novosphingobium sp. FSY-8]|uniref:TonB-dependent receptor n=1 Tax=Novosphingobium ovatum TaxID=1908523 RepID=A0ABW9XA77_9SPHN|nr:TonB-dependent receptor [Novosphingobium ovatum]NBC35426.1 TonB-dependent receptor [Novosphingobium ovatum]